jgi:hypothetical protein
MERNFESNSSHLCTSRTALWCPICGAAAGQGCTFVKGLRFTGHNIYALGQQVRQPLTPTYWEPTPARKDIPDAQRRRLWVN